MADEGSERQAIQLLSLAIGSSQHGAILADQLDRVFTGYIEHRKL
ncbi:hypothetical protein [Microvirga massiliensis]|nr:hypothetical protein [Microvirga massiliensis]